MPSSYQLDWFPTVYFSIFTNVKQTNKIDCIVLDSSSLLQNVIFQPGQRALYSGAQPVSINPADPGMVPFQMAVSRETEAVTLAPVKHWTQSNIFTWSLLQSPLFIPE